MPNSTQSSICRRARLMVKSFKADGPYTGKAVGVLDQPYRPQDAFQCIGRIAHARARHAPRHGRRRWQSIGME